jgi:outer membrane protein assembly factor BamD (BamD/ComL family)
MNEAQGKRDTWTTLLFVLLIVSGLAVLALGLWQAVMEREYVVLGLGLLCVTIPASIYALSGQSGGGGGSSADLSAVGKELAEQAQLLKSINERLLISDQAKRIAYRQNDRQAMRQAIIEDIKTEDYDAAMVLVKEMADTYGYLEEAEQFRSQIIDAQMKRREALIDKAVKRVDEILARRDWDLARHEVGRLRRLYPDHVGIGELPDRVERARMAHKADLERAFLAATEREDVEKAMELMKELDTYLTPEEAAPYLEIARGVVGKRKDNLGVRFKMAVQDRDWIDALNVGEQIIREFPNSMFSKEVRGMLDTLRQRAAGQRAAMASEKQTA